MKNLRIAALAVPLLFCGSVSFASHHVVKHAQTGEVSFQQVLDITEKEGYKNLHKIVFCHKHYVVEAFDANGKEVEFKVDAMTGAVSPAKPVVHHGKHHGKHHMKHHHAKHVKHAEKVAADAAPVDKAE